MAEPMVGLASLRGWVTVNEIKKELAVRSCRVNIRAPVDPMVGLAVHRGYTSGDQAQGRVCFSWVLG